MVIPGLEKLSIGDIIELDPEKLRSLRLDEVREIARRCGIATAGLATVGAVATALVEKAAIEVG